MALYDYIIVGAGASGSVVAARLSRQRNCTVLLVERGPEANTVISHIPAGLPSVLKSGKLTSKIISEPEPALHGRRLVLLEGRAVGGGTVVNGMNYVRGHAQDYDAWAAAGATGWSYADVLPYFLRSERHGSRRSIFHGTDGPMNVSENSSPAPAATAFLAAAAEAGHPFTSDFNGEQQEGYGAFDSMVFKGRRVSAISAFVNPIRDGGQLTVMSGVDVLRIRIEKGRAIGIRAIRDGHEFDIDARREVVLSAGAYASPQLLMLSGIGPGAELNRLGIPVVADRTGVGSNLMNHLEVPVQYQSLQSSSLLLATRFPLRQVAGLQWLLFKTGTAARNHVDAGAFLRSSASIDRPDFKLTFLNIAINPLTRSTPYNGHSFEIRVGTLRPESRGRVMLQSPDPLMPPSIQHNFLVDDRDKAVLRNGVRIARNIASQPALESFRGVELMPGALVLSDTQLDGWIAQQARAVAHQSGTCRMGNATDAASVVDPTLRVIGVEGLRVADASVMPVITAGNTAAPALMIGERAADLIIS